MIAYIQGTVLDLAEQRLTVLPMGSWIGYEVLVAPTTLARAKIGDVVELHVHHHITDVSEALFGFLSIDEKAVFNKLLKVSGVGGKTALSLLGLGISQLVRAIESGDEKVLGSVSGIGKKTALKIIVELKKEISSEELMAEEISQPKLAPAMHQEITDTLVGMGYDRKAVEKVLEKLPEDLDDISSRVVWCIRSLAAR